MRGWKSIHGQAARWHWIGSAAFLGIYLISPQVGGGAQQETNVAQRANQLVENGNYRDAYDLLRELTLADDDVEPSAVVVGLSQAIECLTRLNRVHQIDAYREEVVARHAAQWQVLSAIARTYLDVVHYGYEIAGEFRRGDHRGGGQPVHAVERDRVRALQLLLRAVELLEDDTVAARESEPAMLLLNDFAEALLTGRSAGNQWRLQTATNLDKVPEHEVGWYREDPTGGAAVDADGNPVVYDCPASWADAASDGERWRWVLALRTRYQPELAAQELLDRGRFADSQFGVETLAPIGLLRRQDDVSGDAASEEPTGIFAVHTLKDAETIARLASGVKRFTLSAPYHPIALYQEAAQVAAADSSERREALEHLANCFENRRQYPRAADYWRQLIKEHPAQTHYADRLQQILAPWGALQATMSQPAGRGASLEFRFRNGNRVELQAHALRVADLLHDVQNYLADSETPLDWNQAQIDNLGYRLVVQQQQKYLGDEVAKWQVDLTPAEGHFTRRKSIATPLQQPGAYLVTARMQGGNSQSIVVWIADTSLVKKPLASGALYYVADAVSGRPIANCQVDFFGYRQVPGDRQRVSIRTKNVAVKTDANGLARLPSDEQNQRHQWIATASTPSGRFAFLGYSSVWTGPREPQTYRQVKALALTDRPVYRPGHEVQFKFWIRQPQYGDDNSSHFAAQSFQVEIRDSNNEQVYSQLLTSDAYGGIAGKWKIPTEARLGVYRLLVVNHGGGQFRVEEYKKPEYEVTVTAPGKPVRLGEKLTARIEAKYYFGAPVTQATVHYKIFRTTFHEEWFPPMPWDWLYGPGYAWPAENYDWYPGWKRWGCPGPLPWWIPQNTEPPELVAERHVPIGPVGTIELEIDTQLAQQLHPDKDHRYRIEAEVVDQSRRLVRGTGEVLATREPYRVYLWTDRGHYRAGDTLEVQIAARTPDGKPVAGKGLLRLLRISYPGDQPVETEAAKWALDTDPQGQASLQITAADPGQYRLSYELTVALDTTPTGVDPGNTDASGVSVPPEVPPRVAPNAVTRVEGAQIVTVSGPGFTGQSFQYNGLELIADRATYAPGEKVRLQINSNRAGATVLLFVRSERGQYPEPQIVHLAGKSGVVELDVESGDAPNFFVEAVAIHTGQVHTVVREILVPPAERILNVELVPSADAYLPGQKADLRLKLTDGQGRPYVGSLVVAIYDKALDYIAGGAGPPDIREFFWKWRRSYSAQGETNLSRGEYPVSKPGELQMRPIGIFGDLEFGSDVDLNQPGGGFGGRGGPGLDMVRSMSVRGESSAMAMEAKAAPEAAAAATDAGSAERQPVLRAEFADTALWKAVLETSSDGVAQVDYQLPDNLTTWRIRVWAMGHGTRVGQGTVDVVTRKNLVVRLQTPRFLVTRDEAVISANVHNYLPTDQRTRIHLEWAGDSLDLVKSVPSGASNAPQRELTIPSGGEVRVDWTLAAKLPGKGTLRAVATGQSESDAVQLPLDTIVHGMLRTESYSGSLDKADNSGQFVVTVPEARLPEQTRLEVRYTPSLAIAMLDAVGYLIEYPHGCTEQTLNRFLPAVLVHRSLNQLGISLDRAQRPPTEGNSENGRDPGWTADHDTARSRVTDAAELNRVVQAGLTRLGDMQLSDGGWGWFSGFGERSGAHTTAVVMHGLHIARSSDIPVPTRIFDRGLIWLQVYQQQQLARLDNYDREDGGPIDKDQPFKAAADDLDALVAMVLAECGQFSPSMRNLLVEDRGGLSPYSLATLGLSLHYEIAAKAQPHPSDPATAGLRAVLENLSQYVQQDPSNQTAWLDMPGNAWWYWYGSEYEAQAYYLKLLAAHEPDSKVAPWLVKYLLNNRRQARHWHSTRDTALVVEAFADYLKASGEDRPQVGIEVWVDGQLAKEVRVTSDNLLTFDDRLLLSGKQLATGQHTIELRKQGSGPLYYGGYLTNFTLEDPIEPAGLELKVTRNFYRLVPQAATADVAGGQGQVVKQAVEQFQRIPIDNHSAVESGDLVEVELIVECKNDYEYLLLEDPKAAGFEAVDVRSGYLENSPQAFVEYRDRAVNLFVARLPRGRHSLSYRLRAETPGKFSALPTRISAMYAPLLRGNSAEFKAVVIEQEEQDLTSQPGRDKP
jgi:uncharacterized protein YfaS (alpha-2-macroglobulin family)